MSIFETGCVRDQLRDRLFDESVGFLEDHGRSPALWGLDRDEIKITK